MAIINPSDVSEIEFDEADTDVFKIPDVKERITRLQKHFFPRLELLVKDSLELIEEIYGIDPYAGMSNTCSPNNRKDAATNKVSRVVHVGRSGKRRSSTKDQPLAIKNADAKSIYIHPSYLTFDVLPEGCIRVVFLPFANSVESSFVAKVRQEMQSNFELLNTIFTELEIHYNSTNDEDSTDYNQLINTKRFNLLNGKDIHSLFFYTGAYFFPTNFEDELWNLKVAFVGLYPLLDLFISMGDGRETRLTDMLNKFHGWYFQDNTKESDKNSDSELAQYDYYIPKDNSNDPIEIDPSFRTDGSKYPKNINQEFIEDELEILLPDRENIESKLDFNPENLLDARNRINRAIVQRQGQSKFRNDLLKEYCGKCVITGCDAEAALEAAHIVPYFGAETNCLANGLLLRADIHTLFDLYLISINPETNKVVISSSLINTCYKELNGKTVTPPQNYSANPLSKLAFHYKDFLHKHKSPLH